MSTLTVDIPTSLKIALDKEIARVGGDDSTVITAALAEHLGTPVHKQAISAVQPGPAEIVRRKLCNLMIAATILKPRPRPLVFRVLSER
jgi:hypothetical protein